MVRSTATLWPPAVDFPVVLPRWHLSGARRPPWRLQWARPDLTFPATPHGIQPHTKSLCNSHSSCEQRAQHQDGERPSSRWARLSIDNAQQTTRIPEFAAASRQLTQRPPHTEDGEQRYRRREEVRQSEKAHNAPEGNQSVTVPDSGNRRQKDLLFLFFWLLLFVLFVCLFFPNVGFCLFSNSYLCEHFGCWAVGYMFIRKHVFVYARLSGPKVMTALKVNLHSSTVKKAT